MLLNVGPDRSGQLPENDRDALMAFKDARDEFLGRELVSYDTEVTASAVRGDDEDAFGASNVVDGDVETYWTMDDEQTTGWLEIDLGARSKVDGFIVQEHIALGQRIGGYAWDVLVDDKWQEVVEGVSMGYKRIDKLDEAVGTSKVRLRITQANAVPLVQSVQVLGKSCGRKHRADLR